MEKKLFIISIVTLIISVTTGVVVPLVINEREYKKQQEIREIEYQRQQERYKSEEKKLRKEFIIMVILDKDNQFDLSTRQEAAKEYLSEGYNGVIRDYIYRNKLVKLEFNYKK